MFFRIHSICIITLHCQDKYFVTFKLVIRSFILQIGLAVGDIDAIRKIATVSIFEQQLEFIESIQGIVPKYILKKRVYIPANTYLVNRKTTFQRYVAISY